MQAFSISMTSVLYVGVMSFSGAVGEYKVEGGSSTPAGFVSRVFQAGDGHERRYVVFVPFELKKGDRPPLMLFLNGMGENGDDGVSHVAGPLGPAIWEMKGRFPFVVVFPQCRKGSRWNLDSPDTKWALEILDRTAEELQTDADQVYLTGVSWGGEGVWAIAQEHPDKFAAIAPMCGFSPPSPKVFAEHHLPIWSFVCSGDQIPDLVRQHRLMHESLLRAGASPRYTEVSGFEHDCWDYAYRNPALYEWLLAQRRSRNAADQSRFQLQFTGNDLTGWRGEGDGAWRQSMKLTVTGENPSENSPARLVSNREFKDFELHLEFQLPAESSWSLVGLGTDETSGAVPQWELQIIPPELGSGGLFSKNGQCLQPANALGQQALNRRDWNDVRIRKSRDELSASLNGWALIIYRDPSLVSDSQRIGLQLPARAKRPVQWRHVRINEEVSLTQ